MTDTIKELRTCPTCQEYARVHYPGIPEAKLDQERLWREGKATAWHHTTKVGSFMHRAALRAAEATQGA